MHLSRRFKWLNNSWVQSFGIHFFIFIAPFFLFIILSARRAQTPYGVPITIIGKPKVSNVRGKRIEQEVPKQQIPVVQEGPLGAYDGKSQEILDLYLYELRVLLEKNKRYPPLSEQMNETGTVEVKFTITDSGSFQNSGVVVSSKFQRLNEAALEMVRNTDHFKPLPKEIQKSSLEVQIPVLFQLH